MAKRKNTKTQESDSVYLLKITLYFILGTLWIRITGLDFSGGSISLPFGLVVGVLLASHDHFKIDRKIEFAILLVAAVTSYVAPIGFVLLV